MIDSFKTFGIYGPIYQVLDIVGEDPIKGVMVEVLVVESGERVIIPLNSVEEDPNAV